jgi:uncharacterized protein YdeI (YjbR/CyaY-like superfamily)
VGELPRVRPKSRKAWRDWLEKHHASSNGVWLVYAKKHSGLPSLTYNDAVEEALCFGWIDSKINPIDDAFYMQVVHTTEAGEPLVRVEQSPCRTTAGCRADDRCRPRAGQGGEG